VEVDLRGQSAERTVPSFVPPDEESVQEAVSARKASGERLERTTGIPRPSRAKPDSGSSEGRQVACPRAHTTLGYPELPTTRASLQPTALDVYRSSASKSDGCIPTTGAARWRRKTSACCSGLDVLHRRTPCKLSYCSVCSRALLSYRAIHPWSTRKHSLYLIPQSANLKSHRSSANSSNCSPRRMTLFCEQTL
jgi:hypothetical protein